MLEVAAFCPASANLCFPEAAEDFAALACAACPPFWRQRAGHPCELDNALADALARQTSRDGFDR